MALKNPYSNVRWKALRKRRLAWDEYICAMCGGQADSVDHITELRHGGQLYDWDNLQSLCRPCHTRKTNRITQLGKPLKVHPITGLLIDGS